MITPLPEVCYLCGTTDNLTMDHIPPKGLFPKPRPSNLLTVKCCFSCNNEASKDDEYFRLATSGLANTNNKGKKIWDRVIESTLQKRRIGARIDTLREEMRPANLVTNWGIVQGYALPIDCEPINRVLVRITKALLFATHPEIDRNQLDFEITHIDQFKSDAIEKSDITKMAHYKVGDGVYEHWRGISAEDNRVGIWVHVFYGAAIWMVQHNAGNGKITTL